MASIRCTTCSERHVSSDAVYICAVLAGVIETVCDCGGIRTNDVDHSNCWKINAYWD